MVFIEKNLQKSGPTQFKPLLFKGQRHPIACAEYLKMDFIAPCYRLA